MKLKNISAALSASALLMLFLPVFYCIIFWGSNMNYNAEHKIVTIEGNKVLLVCAVAGALILFLLYYLLKKIPYNRYTAAGVVISSFVVCVLFYVVNVHISKCIAFYGGWDCGMVAKSARWVYQGRGMGYGDYYQIFSNNVPITWLLYKLYSLSASLPGYPYNPEFIWIQFQCFLFSAAIFFTVMTVLITFRKIGISILTLLINCLFLGLSPWEIIPYTDGSTIAIPVFLIFLYAAFLRIKSKWKYALWLLVAFAGVWGGILKATCYVTLIAILLIDFVWEGLSEQAALRSKLKKTAFKTALLLCGYFLAVQCKYGMYRTLNYEYDYDLEIGWRNFLYDGLKEETTGACSSDGLDTVQNYSKYPRKIRNQYEMELIKKRLQEKGFKGLMDFWLRKQVMTYNDGTFSWFQEGFFNAWEYENITDSRWKKPLRKFYWADGKNFIWFTTLSQGIWLFVLSGIIVDAALVLLEAIVRYRRPEEDDAVSHRMCIRTVGIMTFIGTFLFVMLFEGRARYLFNIIPIFSTMAVIGYCDFVDKLCDRISPSR